MRVEVQGDSERAMEEEIADLLTDLRHTKQLPLGMEAELAASGVRRCW